MNLWYNDQTFWLATGLDVQSLAKKLIPVSVYMYGVSEISETEWPGKSNACPLASGYTLHLH